jgi:hypothetical protein
VLKFSVGTLDTHHGFAPAWVLGMNDIRKYIQRPRVSWQCSVKASEDPGDVTLLLYE